MTWRDDVTISYFQVLSSEATRQDQAEGEGGKGVVGLFYLPAAPLQVFLLLRRSLRHGKAGRTKSHWSSRQRWLKRLFKGHQNKTCGPHAVHGLTTLLYSTRFWYGFHSKIFREQFIPVCSRLTAVIEISRAIAQVVCRVNNRTKVRADCEKGKSWVWHLETDIEHYQLGKNNLDYLSNKNQGVFSPQPILSWLSVCLDIRHTHFFRTGNHWFI